MILISTQVVASSGTLNILLLAMQILKITVIYCL